MRLFLAIPLPEFCVQQLSAICRGLPGVRWARPENLHLTLHFIGDEVPPDRFEELLDALAEVEAPPFELSGGTPGRFVNPRGPDVLWAGIDPCPELIELHGRLEQLLRQLGFPRSARRFEPHITLARLKQNTRSAQHYSRSAQHHSRSAQHHSRSAQPRSVSDVRVLEYLREFADFRFLAPVPVDCFQLCSSVLRSDGPVYTVEAEYPLAATGVAWALESESRAYEREAHGP